MLTISTNELNKQNIVILVISPYVYLVVMCPYSKCKRHVGLFAHEHITTQVQHIIEGSRKIKSYNSMQQLGNMGLSINFHSQVISLA